MAKSIKGVSQEDLQKGLQEGFEELKGKMEVQFQEDYQGITEGVKNRIKEEKGKLKLKVSLHLWKLPLKKEKKFRDQMRNFGKLPWIGTTERIDREAKGID